MRTALIILGGFVLLAIFALVGRAVKGTPGIAQGSLLFVPAWFVIAAGNMAMGVLKAGYSAAEEAPILLAIFVPPAALALFFWKKWGG
ncbi:MAG TPA: hypothetical protein VFG30_19825 [Polyangiales bacterium]|nr:hypothetical protein [Polyangiales bacterium]